MLRMASAEVVKRLETRAVAAEQMILLLRKQIQEVQQVAKSSSFEGEIDALKRENETLRQQIAQQKDRLCKEEAARGGLNITVPSGDSVQRPAMSDAEPPKAAAALVSAPAGETKKAEAPKEAKGKKEKPKKKEGGGGGGGAKQQEEQPVHVGRLDMRVGLIRSAKKHPDADALYVEEVDVGEEKPRTVISGLVKFIPLEEMQNRPAILLCNLKPSKMRGILSEAMVMCASTPEKVEILSPPAGAQPGDPVEVSGFARAPDAQLNPKKKVFESCAPDLKVNGSGEATFRGVPWTVNGLKCTAPSLVDVQIK